MSLLKTFVSYTSTTLKRFIFTAALIVSAVTFGVVIIVVSWVYLLEAKQRALKDSSVVAEQIQADMARRIGHSDTGCSLEHQLDNYRMLFPRLEICLRPTPQGKAPDKVRSRTVTETVATGKPSHHLTTTRFDHAFPIKAQTSCLRCHTEVTNGQLLGVLVIRENVTLLRNSLLDRAVLAFILLLPIPLLMAWLVSRFVNRHLGDAISRLNRKVHAVTTVSDLTQLGEELESEGETLKFGDLEAIYGEFGSLVARIRDVAVGREMLEFEIKVLERFIITGDSIRDWKERVSFLLEEINKVMPAYALFCIFQIEDESFDIEVFWSAPPSATTRSFMEEILHEQASHEHLRYRPGSIIQIIHNISDESKPLLEIGRHEIELETKSLYLEQPQIGGVVGIGVQSQIMSDPIRSLVINSILTTLLNVVGSIKAIYKYTRDLEYYATRDPLTNLYNQRVFWELLGIMTASACW